MRGNFCHLWTNLLTKVLVCRMVNKRTQEDPSWSYFEEHPGYRCFHLGNIHRVFQEGHKCRNAKNLFVEDQAKVYGQNALFCLQCSKCKKIRYLPTSKTTGN